MRFTNASRVLILHWELVPSALDTWLFQYISRSHEADTRNHYVHFCRSTQKAEQPVEIPKCWKVWARLYPGFLPMKESTAPFVLSTTLEAATSATLKALHWKRTRAIGNQLVCMAHQRGQAGSQGCTWIGACLESCSWRYSSRREWCAEKHRGSQRYFHKEQIWPVPKLGHDS